MQKREVSISLAAVMAGVAADFFSTYIVFDIFGNVVAIAYGVTTERPDWANYVVTNAVHDNPVLFATQALLLIACSLLGGYVAARVAGIDEVENAFAASLVTVVFSIYIMIAGEGGALLLNIFFTLIAPLFYRLGAQIRVVQLAKRK